jgi:hypothetical protein
MYGPTALKLVFKRAIPQRKIWHVHEILYNWKMAVCCLLIDTDQNRDKWRILVNTGINVDVGEYFEQLRNYSSLKNDYAPLELCI